MKELLKPSLNWLLLLVPAVVVMEFVAPQHHTMLFIGSCLAVLPLAGLMGKATEHLAERAGEGIGGLLNATFGNAAELIIAFFALKRGLYPVVKASLTGSIIGNILLVLGASVFAGGMKFKVQHFNAPAARIQSTMLTLAAIAMIVPAAFHYLAGPRGLMKEGALSTEISIVLLITYVASLLFSLRTHKQFFAPPDEAAKQEPSEHHQPWSLQRSLLVLGGATALIAWMSEILIGSVQLAAQSFGMTSVFVGVIVVAIVGNAAEHSTAVAAAMKNRMELSLGIAIGSSIQIALFVAPVLVLLSYQFGPAPMDLVFTPAEVLAVALSVAIAGQIASDGQSNWLEGVQLLAVYLIMGMIFYFLPDQEGLKAH